MPNAKYLGLRGGSLATVISTVCGLCFLCFGYAQGVMGGLLTVPQFLDRFPQVDTLDPAQASFHSAWVTGLAVGSWNLGCLVSAILCIVVSDSLGRRRTLLLGITIWTIGEIIQTSSYSFAQFIVGRCIAGFGNGFTTSTAPAYQAECVKSHRKGTILMISAGAFVAAGYALSYWLTFAFAYVDSSAAWRVPIAFQIIFSLPAIALLFFLPESPRWLILTGREQEALNVLAALNDADVDDFEIKDEFLQIKDAILIMAQGSTASIFSNKERRGFHRVVLAYFVQVFQQGTGINLVLQYLSWIFFTRMNYTGWLARLLAGCSATTYFLASFVAVVGIDRFWGRRSLMMFGASGMSGCMILITIMQYLWTERNVTGTRIASTVFLFAFSMFFAIGWQGMAWLYQVEIVPLRIRGPANAISTSANWMLNFVVVFITPIAFTNIGYRTWIIFAATNFAIIPLVYFFYPETAFRSLEEVDVVFALVDEEPGNPWLSVVRISKNEPLWFGKRGEKRLDFQYQNSSWHRKLMGSSGSSGNGTGSDSNRVMNEKDQAAEDFNRSLQPTEPGLGIVTSNCYAGQQNGYRPASPESPIDPRLSPPNLKDTSPTSTMGDKKLRKKNSRTHHKDSLSSEPTLIHQDSHDSADPPPIHRNKSERDTWYQSKESLASAEATGTPVWYNSETAAPLPDPPIIRSRSNSSLPPSRPTSRGRQRRSRPMTADTQRSFLFDNESDHHAITADERIESESLSSVNYPGRLNGDVRRGLTRTASGRETYLPDGIVEDLRDGSVERNIERRLSTGSAIGRRFTARDAGRAF
ncbi:hypothetical protein BU25DRAFT_433891 [Macroventuria anomochaeta]|uniref:Uncharacterized protein n=1 Tax=Macroventuria anomochaeta TaxID=301207 RepID=A0ACB6RPX3_9PLEO|nr:uncharacterized protein BU25DRAFT_433891 [Macroventuria anomochaeta]KAF2623824.1 hypothetical protein BU25DRAFT_433891 [Macroventuria anomochaeta]